MTLQKGEPRTLQGDLRDIYRRIKALEAHPSSGGGAGGSCEFEPDHNRRLPIDMGNYIGEAGYGFTARINEFNVDTGSEGNGYYAAPAFPDGPQEFDVTYWTPWLGPVGARFVLNIVTHTGPDAGRLHLYAQRMVVSGNPGMMEPEEDPIDLFAGFAGHFADLYTASPQKNIWNVSYQFGIEGDCDAPFTAADPDAPYGYGIDGGPGFYRLWLVVEGKNGSSGGYECKIQNVWLKRVTDDEP